MRGIRRIAWAMGLLILTNLSSMAQAYSYTLELTQGTFPRSWIIPGTQTSLQIGGTIKTDLILDLDGKVPGTGLLVDQPDYRFLPINHVDVDFDNMHTRFHVKQSRVFLKTATPTCYGNLNTYLEFDFFADANRFNTLGTDTNASEELTSNPVPTRLKHAYGRFYKFLAGQTWSNFQDPEAIPEVFTLAGLPGRTWVRQTQIRYEDDLGCMSYGIALENPEVDFTDNSVAGDFRKHDKFPDATAYVKIPLKMGYVRFQGVIRSLQIKSNVLDFDEARMGWGIGMSGRLNVDWRDLPGTGHHLKFSVLGGSGLGRYLDSFQNYALSCVNTNTEKLSSFGVYGAYQHCFQKQYRGNIGYGFARVKNDSSMPGTANAQFRAFFANVVWSPVENVDFGIEYIQPRRKRKDSEHGSLRRVLGTCLFHF